MGTIDNLGNSCYINATLSFLFHIPFFADKIEKTIVLQSNIQIFLNYKNFQITSSYSQNIISWLQIFYVSLIDKFGEETLMFMIDNEFKIILKDIFLQLKLIKSSAINSELPQLLRILFLLRIKEFDLYEQQCPYELMQIIFQSLSLSSTKSNFICYFNELIFIFKFRLKSSFIGLNH